MRNEALAPSPYNSAGGRPSDRTTVTGVLGQGGFVRVRDHGAQCSGASTDSGLAAGLSTRDSTPPSRPVCTRRRNGGRGSRLARWRETERGAGIAIRMRHHAEALSRSHLEYSGALAYLQGDGLLSLHSSPSKAKVWLAPYEIRNRRRIPGTERRLGNTPSVQTPLAMGRYQVRIAADGRLDVAYPINIERQQHWDGVAPTAKPSPAVYLPRLQEVGDDECYVPAGWCIVGGDPNVPTPTPRRRMWVDSFAFQRDPVNNGDYLAFVQALHEVGEDVLPHIPRLPAGNDDPTGHTLFQQNEADVFLLPTDEHVLE